MLVDQEIYKGEEINDVFRPMICCFFKRHLSFSNPHQNFSFSCVSYFCIMTLLFITVFHSRFRGHVRIAFYFLCSFCISFFSMILFLINLPRFLTKTWVCALEKPVVSFVKCSRELRLGFRFRPCQLRVK